MAPARMALVRTPDLRILAEAVHMPAVCRGLGRRVVHWSSKDQVGVRRMEWRKPGKPRSLRLWFPLAGARRKGVSRLTQAQGSADLSRRP